MRRRDGGLSDAALLIGEDRRFFMRTRGGTDGVEGDTSSSLGSIARCWERPCRMLDAPSNLAAQGCASDYVRSLKFASPKTAGGGTGQ